MILKSKIWKPKISHKNTIKILYRFASFCINLIFMYCLYVEKKLVTIKHLFLNFLGVKMCDKMAISAYILKIIERTHFKASNES